ncbi:MAG: CoA protein activase [Chloroflexi bacterium]|nr:CoA protein activase [Chloroflexota bacterium]
MRIGIPHCGNAYVIAEALVQKLGNGKNELIIPPPTSHRTLDLGVKYSPVEACLPFKLTLGNLIEACELGADTLIHARGTGVCRLGYYVKEQEQIIRDLGYDAHFFTLDVSQNRVKSIMRLIKELTNDAPWSKIISAFSFAMGKLFALDEMEKVIHKVRAVELEKGRANQVYRQAVKAISEAQTIREVRNTAKEYVKKLGQIPKDPKADPVKVGIVGEVFVVLDPFANMDIEMELGKLGVEVERTMSLSRWVKYRLFLNYLGIDEWEQVHKAALPYLRRSVGGDGWESVGEKVVYARDGYDGVIHLAPFTCMPEIVAQNIMPSTEEDIPVLTILYDEQMAKPGMITRLEAFVDLLKFRRKRRRK